MQYTSVYTIVILELAFVIFLYLYLSHVENNFMTLHFYNNKQECINTYFKYSPNLKNKINTLSLVGIDKRTLQPFMTIYNIKAKSFKEHLNISPLYYIWDDKNNDIKEVGNSRYYDDVTYTLVNNNTQLIITFMDNDKKIENYIENEDTQLEIKQNEETGMYYINERILCDDSYPLNEIFTSTYTQYLKYKFLYDHNKMKNDYDNIIIRAVCADKNKLLINKISSK